MMNNSIQEGHSTKEDNNTTKNKQPTNFYSTWSGSKNPRIVRVSRAFGGKDRHSKVTTVRGLRDRRIRLSVQTAIQLYDLQDKLGFNQPSKVVDWLINEAQHEIDKLPPLQMPKGNFSLFPQFITPSRNISDSDDVSRVQERNSYLNMENSVMAKEDSIHNPLYWNSDVYARNRSKEAMEIVHIGEQASSSRKTNVEENQSFIMPNNSISQIPQNFPESINAYNMYYSSQVEAYNPIPLFGTNSDGKLYSHFHLSSLLSSSEGIQALKNQRSLDEKHGN